MYHPSLATEFHVDDFDKFKCLDKGSSKGHSRVGSVTVSILGFSCKIAHYDPV